jgi:hypothetical protein
VPLPRLEPSCAPVWEPELVPALAVTPCEASACPWLDMLTESPLTAVVPSAVGAEGISLKLLRSPLWAAAAKREDMSVKAFFCQLSVLSDAL